MSCPREPESQKKAIYIGVNIPSNRSSGFRRRHTRAVLITW